MAEKKTTTKKAAPKKATEKKTVKKPAVKKTTTKKPAPEAQVTKAKDVEIVESMPVLPEVLGLQPTNYTEISRIHRSTLSTLKGSLVVTSTITGEGTSLMAMLLARRSAENGKRTLLIDLNMRNTSITKELSVTRKTWDLPSRMINEPLNDLIEPSDGLPTLDIIAAPLDEASIRYLKDVHRATQFFTSLERHYDHVIVDTTPVAAMNRGNADPVILAAAARRTALVLMTGVTPREKVKKAVHTLREAGANIEGVVVNNINNPSLKDELLSFIGMFKKVSPGFYSWLKYKILNSEAFN